MYYKIKNNEYIFSHLLKQLQYGLLATVGGGSDYFVIGPHSLNG